MVGGVVVSSSATGVRITSPVARWSSPVPPTIVRTDGPVGSVSPSTVIDATTSRPSKNSYVKWQYPFWLENIAWQVPCANPSRGSVKFVKGAM
jgi:hypothetical protein